MKSFDSSRGRKSPNARNSPAYDWPAIKQRCFDLGLHRIPKNAAAISFLDIDPQDLQLLEYLMEKIAEAEQMNMVVPDPFRATNPTPYEELPGTIILGRVPETGMLWKITPEMLTTHCLLISRSGGGKSNTIFLILAQLIQMRRHDQAL
jgi:hypothetical protein